MTFAIKTGDGRFNPLMDITVNGFRFIPADWHDRRVTELLEANNRYLERARAAERVNQIPAADAANAGGGHEVTTPHTIAGKGAGQPDGAAQRPSEGENEA